MNYYAIHSVEQNTNYAFNKLLHCEPLTKEDKAYLDVVSGKLKDEYFLPTEMNKGFEKAITEENLFRRLGNFKNTAFETGNIVITTSDGDAEVVGDSRQFPEDNDTIAEKQFKAHKIASISKLNNVFIRDKHYDVQGYLKTDFAKRFGRCEEDVFINGSGVDEPQGILNAAEVGKAISSSEITADNLIDLYFSIDKKLRKNAVWLMSDETLMEIRKIKDGSGRFILTENDTIFGKPVIVSNFMSDSTKPIAFGDFSYYWIIQRKPLTVKILTELYSLDDKTGFAAYERLDGKLIRTDAIKLLKIEELKAD